MRKIEAKQNLKILSKKDYLECHLTDAAFRYIKFPLYNKTFDGQLEQKPISIKKDFKLNGSDPLFLRHYSCSEKKIVAFLIGKNSDFNRLRGSNMPKNELSNYDLRVTRKPCVACMPALVGFNKIIFNYNNISSLLSGTEEYTLKSQKDLHMPYFFKKI